MRACLHVRDHPAGVRKEQNSGNHVVLVDVVQVLAKVGVAGRQRDGQGVL